MRGYLPEEKPCLFSTRNSGFRSIDSSKGSDLWLWVMSTRRSPILIWVIRGNRQGSGSASKSQFFMLRSEFAIYLRKVQLMPVVKP
jgi:hypothetical protein